MALFSNHGVYALAPMFCSLFLSMVSAATIQSPEGFSIAMIPTYSKNSPVSPSNLTDGERYALMVESSHRRANRLASIVSTYKNTATSNGTHLEYAASPEVSQALDSHYLVQIGIGTPPVSFLLLLDTGSSLTWVQSRTCTVCFPLNQVGYDLGASTTYKFLHCDHPHCMPKKCINMVCLYKIYYGDQSNSYGTRAVETFTVYSAETNRYVAISELIFGSGLINKVTWHKNDGPQNEIAGIFGMGTGSLSFVSQINMAGEGRRFSHCLTHWTSPQGGHSHLKFGNSASLPQGAPVYTTPLVRGTTEYYYVNLLHISVDGINLNFRPDLFMLRRDGTGGMIVDSGAAVTYLYTEAFEALVERLELIFARAGLRPTATSSPQFSTLHFCWKAEGSFTYPTIVFHFDGGATFQPDPAAIYVIEGQLFCLQISSTDTLAILGAFTMTNHIFQYDLERQTVSFARQDCTH